MTSSNLKKIIILTLCGSSLIATGGVPGNFDDGSGFGVGGFGNSGGGNPPQAKGILAGSSANEAFSGVSNFVSSTGVVVSLGDDDQPLSLKKNSEGGYDTMLNGSSISFKAADWKSDFNAYITTDSNAQAHYFTTFGLQDAEDKGYKFADVVFSSQAKLNSSQVSASYGAFGSKTTDMPTSGSQSFTGEAFAIVTEKNLNHFRPEMTGDFLINVSFTANKLSGKIDNLTRGGKHISGQLSITKGNITNSSYEADLVGSSSLSSGLDEIVTGKLQGGFYGDGAAETAGKFTIDSPTFAGVGGFRAKK